jgi:predicted PurR-regulated permease PerM
VSSPADPHERSQSLNRAVDVAIRIGLVATLIVWCLLIVRPFIQPFVWGAVIAVAAAGPHVRLERWLGGRSSPAAALLVLVALSILILPTVALTTSLVDTATQLANRIDIGQLSVPPPPDRVASWPIVGRPLFESWSAASQNIESVLTQFRPQLEAIGMWLVSTGATTGVGLVKFVISLIVAGVLLAHGEQVGNAARGIATRVAGERGPELLLLARATVQGVTRGILGVALIQGLLAGLGMLAVGVPAAGLWALLVLVFAVVQLPTLIVLGPIVVWVFSTASTGVAVLFAIWSLIVGGIDTVLKPLLMGRGLQVPMLVVFMGAIGGFMLDGIIGLFVGAVVLALGYTLLTAWLAAAEPPEAPTGDG